jgi:superoxide reductase
MKNEIYRCSICGRIVEVVEDGQGPIVCCGQPMEKLEPNTVDAAKEKHVPVVEKTEGGFLVKIGEVPHPMEESHYIMWIEIRYDDQIERVFLKPGDEPQAEFCIKAENIEALAYCNLHGLWQSKK